MDYIAVVNTNTYEHAQLNITYFLYRVFQSYEKSTFFN